MMAACSELTITAFARKGGARAAAPSKKRRLEISRKANKVKTRLAKRRKRAAELAK